MSASEPGDDDGSRGEKAYSHAESQSSEDSSEGTSQGGTQVLEETQHCGESQASEASAGGDDTNLLNLRPIRHGKVVQLSIAILSEAKPGR